MSVDKHIDDLELISKYKKSKDQKWMGELYSRYVELVFGLCLKYYKNKADAEDALMSVYELVSQKLLTHEVKNFKPWLYTVTKNYCFEKLRQKTRVLQKENEAAGMYSEDVFHLDNIEKEEKLNKLETCMKSIDKDQSNCVRLFYYEKKSYQQIATIESISWSKVRSLIQNGRRMLKNCMEK